MANIGSLTFTVDARLDDFKKAMRDIPNEFTKLGNAARAAGKTLTATFKNIQANFKGIAPEIQKLGQDLANSFGGKGLRGGAEIAFNMVRQQIKQTRAEILALGKEAEQAGKSVEQYTKGAITTEQVEETQAQQQRQRELEAATTGLKSRWLLGREEAQTTREHARAVNALTQTMFNTQDPLAALQPFFDPGGFMRDWRMNYQNQRHIERRLAGQRMDAERQIDAATQRVQIAGRAVSPFFGMQFRPPGLDTGGFAPSPSAMGMQLGPSLHELSETTDEQLKKTIESNEILRQINDAVSGEGDGGVNLFGSSLD